MYLARQCEDNFMTDSDEEIYNLKEKSTIFVKGASQFESRYFLLKLDVSIPDFSNSRLPSVKCKPTYT